MRQRVLITGGAGFIGSHLADALLADGHTVRAFDSLDPQVHGSEPERPAYLDRDVELVVGDVRDPIALERALEGMDAVVHLAARVGVGQSMYEPRDYAAVNSVGTATLLEALARRPVERLVVASSMSIYGEGLYRDGSGHLHSAVERDPERLRRGQWDCLDEHGAALEPLPTPEWKPPCLASVYALSKFDQERLCLLWGRSRGVGTVALRLFNVYGPRQALSNPYTGVLAIFAARLLNRRPPVVFEDGHQLRDFVSVHDVARAFALALSSRRAVGQVLNIASGQTRTVLEVAADLATVLDQDLEPEVPGRCRVGDVRHCTADISRARDLLDYRPEVDFERGLAELAAWLRGRIPVDRVELAHQELVARGLVR